MTVSLKRCEAISLTLPFIIYPTSLPIGLVAAGLWFYPVGPIVKRHLEERKMEQENATNKILRNVAAESSSQASYREHKHKDKVLVNSSAMID
jgi:hypothetical protein